MVLPAIVKLLSVLPAIRREVEDRYFLTGLKPATRKVHNLQISMHRHCESSDSPLKRRHHGKSRFLQVAQLQTVNAHVNDRLKDEQL